MSNIGNTHYTAQPALASTDQMLEAGDLDGFAVWKRIVKAVEELQRTSPGGGEARH